MSGRTQRVRLPYRQTDFTSPPSMRSTVPVIHRARRSDERHNVRHLLRLIETANAGLLEELLLRFFKSNLPGSHPPR